MNTRPGSSEALVRRMLPCTNPNHADRAHAWADWQTSIGAASVLKFIRIQNDTSEADEDILQDAMITAYMEVERGRYEQRAGIPFTAYVKGIARNKIREARRRNQHLTTLDDLTILPEDAVLRQLEVTVEHREQRNALKHGLSRLTLQRRQVLERYVSGVTTAEIAAELEMSEESVRQHKSRGLRHLRQMVRFK